MMDQILTIRIFLGRQLNFVCFFVSSAGNGDKCVSSAVDVICPLVVVVRVRDSAACVSAARGFGSDSRVMFWHLVIGGQS